jgi:hypothetical protein
MQRGITKITSFVHINAGVDESVGRRAGINVPDAILVGRFSGDTQWPVLGLFRTFGEGQPWDSAVPAKSARNRSSAG